MEKLEDEVGRNFRDKLSEKFGDYYEEEESELKVAWNKFKCADVDMSIEVCGERKRKNGSSKIW